MNSSKILCCEMQERLKSSFRRFLERLRFYIAMAEEANADVKELQETLGPVGMVKFMQQYDTGYGDYTKEKQERTDISLEEIDILLRR